MEDDPLLTVPEVAARLRVSEESIRRWLRDGKLRGRRLPPPAGWRIPTSELRRFLEGDETQRAA
jgi:excisionase family DNA binding protein